MTNGDSLPPAQATLHAIGLKVKTWEIDKTFDTEIAAKQWAAKRCLVNSGVMVAPYSGGTFTVFVWTNRDELAF